MAFALTSLRGGSPLMHKLQTFSKQIAPKIRSRSVSTIHNIRPFRRLRYIVGAGSVAAILMVNSSYSSCAEGEEIPSGRSICMKMIISPFQFVYHKTHMFIQALAMVVVGQMLLRDCWIDSDHNCLAYVFKTYLSCFLRTCL